MSVMCSRERSTVGMFVVCSSERKEYCGHVYHV